MPDGIFENVEKLREFLKDFTYKFGWEFGTHRQFLKIKIQTVDSRLTDSHRHHPFESSNNYVYEDETFSVVPTFSPSFRFTESFYILHSIAVPPFPFPSPEEMERWFLDRVIDVEIHEAVEFFKFNGKAIYFPDHERPYRIQRVEDECSPAQKDMGL